MKHTALALTIMTGALGAAHAQDYPTRPIRLIAPFAAGSSVDILARALAQPLSRQLGQPVVVENKGGAGGNIGVDMVAKAPKDGYTIGVESRTIIRPPMEQMRV
ncbi:hypothetical protein GCM10009097_44110 [Pigmentiphaga daeguensis]|uniref:Tripartite tricarboxylate transporter family receptor n=1 Tax=Pigmentiphaga daeguensis TaxID=414049 RepID=A0ABN1CLZ1_9BURK